MKHISAIYQPKLTNNIKMSISDFPSIKYVNARFCFSCGLRVREKPFGPFQAWRTKPLLVLPCISFACPAMHVRLKHVCVSMVSFSRVQFEMVCAEMLLEITKNVWMSSLWIHLFFWNSGACENRVRKKNDIFVSVLDGQTCIILESQHIYVYVLDTGLVYLNQGSWRIEILA